MEKDYSAILVSVNLESTFEAFTQQLEASLGRFNLSALEKAAHDPVVVEAEIKKMLGEESLVLFNVEDLGNLLSLTGPAKKAKRYFVGNFLMAAKIISMDLRLGLYAPIRVLVYESDESKVIVNYEKPSSLFSRLENELISKTSLGLDAKLKNIIESSDKKATAL
ncbi:hypothetical protein GCM10028818_56210 [Spirosoma horti]